MSFLVSLAFAFAVSFFLANAMPGSFQDDETNIVQKTESPDIFKAASGYLKGNWGTSWSYPDQTVIHLVGKSMQSTLLLQVIGIFLVVVVSFGLSVLSLKSERSFRWIQNISFVGTAFPTLFIAPILIYFLSFQLNLLPLRYDNSWVGYLLPLFCLSFRPASFGVQILSHKWRETQFQDYFRTARAKGLSITEAFWGHGLKNSALSYLAQMFQFAGQIMSGAILVETLFAVPGIGTLFVESLRSRDVPVLMATIFIFCFVYILAQTSLEVFHQKLEPREGRLI